MRSDRTPSATAKGTASFAAVWLLLRVHFDAARHAPGPYFTALWWRFRRKRVRARAQFAPLLGASRLAYQLWLREEAPVCRDSVPGAAPIVALVDVGARGSSDGLAGTLRSLAAEGVEAICVDVSAPAALAEAADRIDWSKSPWLMPMVAGDVLATGAATAYQRAATQTRTTVVYADDDLLDAAGRRHAVHFKPVWNAELFAHFDYLTGACMVRATVADLAACSGPEWAAELVAAAIDAEPPLHLAQVLHHRRSRPDPSVPAALPIASPMPPISVIVPTRNRLDLLRTCIEGLERTDYPDLEVVIVDNGSDDPATLAWLDALKPPRYRVLRQPGPFNFSALNNRAVEQANGQLLCLLNNDIEVLTPDWLRVMAVQAMRPEVGAVGAQLLYPDGRIQHAGVVLGVGQAAAHAHRLVRPDDEGYFRRHALPQFVSAVTAACLVVQRERFMAVDGLDEARFAVAFNDVDLCLRLNARGWQSFYEPRARLVHHESVSRGLDRDLVGAARFAGELAALKELWGTERQVDPFHHPELNRFSERFVVGL